MTDEPLQVFYSTNFTIVQWKDRPSEYSHMMADMVEQNSLKVVLIPEARFQILIRVENLEDIFDATPETYTTFDVHKYADYIYKNANDGWPAGSITIEERTLSNMQDMETMKSNKFKWNSEDDDNVHLKQPYPEDESATNVTLQPQRIRLFRVTYTVSTEQEITQ